MFKNAFIITLRNLKKNPFFSFINALGLSLGISASLVIYLIVNYDFSFEKFQDDRDRIYRIVTTMTFAGTPFPNSGVPVPLHQASKKDLTGIEVAAPIFLYNDPRVAIQNKETPPSIFKKQKKIIFTDSEYFKLIPFTWLEGNADKALNEPFAVVLTESRAKQYFPRLKYSEILGKSITYDDSAHASVTGIVKDLDAITDFTFQEFISYATIRNTNLKNLMNGLDDWGSVSSSFQLVVKLTPRTSPKSVEAQLVKLRKQHEKDKSSTTTTTHDLQNLADIHFNEKYGNFNQRRAHKPTLYGLILLAIFLLTLGCINFINLTTAQATKRAKEIGIRKTLGSLRRQLIFQFLTETFLLTFIATLVSVLITPLILALFKDFVPEEMHFNLLHQPDVIAFLMLLILVVSILSGFYPALILSGFKPILVLKNQAYTGSGKTRSSWLRQGLTVTQFVIAQVFVIGTFIVSKQISYSINKDLGFRKDAIVFFSTPWNTTSKNSKLVLADKIRNMPEVERVSLNSGPPSSSSSLSTTMKYKDGKKEQEVQVEMKNVDTNYLNLYDLKLVAGRSLLPTDSSGGLIINEAFAKLIEPKDLSQVVGQNINKGEKQVPIVGVVKDFHMKSLHQEIKPIALEMSRRNNTPINLSVRFKAGSDNTASWKTAITKMGSEWKRLFPEEEFDYKFFDESIAAFYETDQKISRLLAWAAGLATLISCLGLLGLVIYTTNQRTKEIGVRKVLGATVGQVVSLLSKDFVKLVLIAFVIAAPIAWWAMNKWLQNFQYRTTMSWWVFAAAGGLMVFIALITLSFQTVRSASANPVKSLRNE